jgi:hypothetical protein
LNLFLSPGILNIKDINLIKLTNISSIDVNEDTKPKCGAKDDYTIYYGVQLNFNNLEIEKDSNSYIKVKSAKTYSGTCSYLTRGYPVSLVGQSIINNSNDFNISIIGGDSADGYSPSGEGEAPGGTPSSGGSSAIVLNYLENNGYTNLEMKSGFGGNGGNGQTPEGVNDPVGNGGWGGTGGEIFYKIISLKNYIDSNLSINLITGNGGRGGDTGMDRGGPNQTDYAAAGSGRDGGSIYFGLPNWPNLNYDRLSMIYNKGMFDFNAIAGNGGNGGIKNNNGYDPDGKYSGDQPDGKDGDGGNGGNIYDKKITPKFKVITDYKKATLELLKKEVGFPMIIKPAELASSLLVNICYHKEELEDTLKKAFKKIRKADSVMADGFVPAVENISYKLYYSYNNNQSIGVGEFGTNFPALDCNKIYLVTQLEKKNDVTHGIVSTTIEYETN